MKPEARGRGFKMGMAFKHWKSVKAPEEHEDLSVVPNEPVYIDMWPEDLPSHATVLQDMQATANRALETIRSKIPGESFEEMQKMNDMLFEQMADGSEHLPEATLRRLAVRQGAHKHAVEIQAHRTARTREYGCQTIAV